MECKAEDEVWEPNTKAVVMMIDEEERIKSKATLGKTRSEGSGTSESKTRPSVDQLTAQVKNQWADLGESAEPIDDQRGPRQCRLKASIGLIADLGDVACQQQAPALRQLASASSNRRRSGMYQHESETVDGDRLYSWPALGYPKSDTGEISNM
ncbi:hypothetical protein [Sporisorium scitamineum]|uniref:Uncharacterized protein n=1 Tax=Sporisorium scitamineum TaxID=49012 RepID=A0A0F7S9F9_9BASI|nr:hypothetical protein [Sporisorium scitamineum]